MLVWLGGYAVLIRHFMPRIRARSKDRAAARAVVTGQVVDTLTNIATVKLFSHGMHEDQAALDALAGYRGATHPTSALTSAAFRFWLMALAGTLPVLLIGGTLLLLDPRARRRAGDIATAGLLATRIAQMSGWVSMTAMGIFANVGEIEDGMRTLSPPHAIVDAADAAAPATRRAARSTSRTSASATAARRRRSTASPCTSAPASGWRWSAAPARARPPPSRCCCASTRSRAAASCSTAPTSAT